MTGIPRDWACVEARGRIQRVLDGLATSEERTELDVHRARCEECAEAYAAARHLAAALSQWERVRPQGVFAARVMEAVRAASRPRPIPLRVPVLAGLLALAISALVSLPITRGLIADLVVSGADQGTAGTLDVARALAVVSACVVALAQRGSTLVEPLLSPGGATANALLIVVRHVGSAAVAAPLVGTAVLAIVVLIRMLTSRSERRGHDALCL